jgi:hypothetical protein
MRLAVVKPAALLVGHWFIANTAVDLAP